MIAEGSMESGYKASMKLGRISGLVPELLSGTRTGRVHSVFRTSMNLEFDGHLIFAGAGTQGLCCFGICPVNEEFAAALPLVKQGDLAVWKEKGEKLRIYGSGGMILFDLRTMETVDLRIPNLSKVQDAAATPLFDRLSAGAEQPDLGLPMDETFRAHAKTLAGGFLKAESDGEETEESEETVSEALLPAVRYFFGRGIGLTPAGDDILTGYGAVLQAFGEAKPLLKALTEVRKAAKTTDVSEAYLDSMRRGCANETFVGLLEHIEDTGTYPDLLIADIKDIGHTSGRDTLYGAHLGLVYIATKQRIHKRKSN